MERQIITMAHCNECFSSGAMEVGIDNVPVCFHCGEDAVRCNGCCEAATDTDEKRAIVKARIMAR